MSTAYAEPLSFSLTEADALAQKAARGAGLGWGMAEEAGFAVRWLCGYGADGLGALLACLAAQRSMPHLAPGQVIGQGQGLLCPLHTGSVLLDSVEISDGPLAGPLQLAPLCQPLLMLPFLAQAASVLGQQLVVAYKAGTVALPGPAPLPVAPSALCGALRLGLGAPLGPEWRGPTARVPQGRAACDAATLAALELLALKTTVPATEASRRSGAGAGTNDND